MNANIRMQRGTALHVGGGLKAASNRMLDAVARFEHGETVREDHVTFADWAALFSILTPKRYELLRHVHRHPEKSIRALARATNPISPDRLVEDLVEIVGCPAGDFAT